MTLLTYATAVKSRTAGRHLPAARTNITENGNKKRQTFSDFCNSFQSSFQLLAHYQQTQNKSR